MLLWVLPPSTVPAADGVGEGPAGSKETGLEPESDSALELRLFSLLEELGSSFGIRGPLCEFDIFSINYT